MTKKQRSVRAVSPPRELIKAIHGIEDEETNRSDLPIQRSPKPRTSPKPGRLKVHNPLSKKFSSVPSTSDDPKYRAKDVAKAMRRRAVASSVLVLSETAEGGETTPEKKKSRFRNLINSAYQKNPKPAASADVPTKGPVFGVALDLAVTRSRISHKLALPRVFQESIMYIETFALQREGIYRIPGYRVKVNELKIKYNNGDVVNLTEYDPETVGMLLKLYLRELPDPLLTRKMGAKFEGVLQIGDKDLQVEVLRGMLRELPPENFSVLSWLCLHIHHVSRNSDTNKMSLTNMVIILSPTLLISNTLLCVLCEKCEEVFPGVVIDPNKGIPTLEELEELNLAHGQVAGRVSIDHTLQITRNELISDLVWAQARNDALKHVKDDTFRQIKEGRKDVRKYEKEMTVLKEQGLTPQNDNYGCAMTPQNDTYDDLRVGLNVLHHESSRLEIQKTDLYNVILSEMLSCVDAYTEIRYIQAYNDTGDKTLLKRLVN